jgi:hypothetical protein
MSALSASAEGDGDPDLPLSQSEASGGVPRLLLSDEEWRLEHVLAYAMALEFGRVAVRASHTAAARYVSQVVDNSRALCAGSPRLHLNLLRSQVRWLRDLPVGSGELRW